MKPLALGTLVLTLVAGAPVGTDAQSPIIVEPPATPPAQPLPPPPAAPTYEEYRRAELAWYARRSRNVLIGTAAATAVGAALVFPAEANQCNSLEVAEATGVRCTPGGMAMVVFGYTLLVGGVVGMLTSGIMLGVWKGQLRRSGDRAAHEKSRAVRWDPAHARFVF